MDRKQYHTKVSEWGEKMKKGSIKHTRDIHTDTIEYMYIIKAERGNNNNKKFVLGRNSNISAQPRYNRNDDDIELK